MTVTPTISVSNAITNAMTATSSTSMDLSMGSFNYIYVLCCVSAVSGTDLARNSYSGGESLS